MHPEANTSIEESYKDTQFDMCAEGHSHMIMKSGKPAKSLEGPGKRPARRR